MGFDHGRFRDKSRRSRRGSSEEKPAKTLPPFVEQAMKPLDNTPAEAPKVDEKNQEKTEGEATPTDLPHIPAHSPEKTSPSQGGFGGFAVEALPPS